MAVTKLTKDITLQIADKMRYGKTADGIKTGFTDLDRVLRGGFERGNLYVLGGRPSMGKTSFAISILLNQVESKTKCVYATPEMSSKQLIRRIIAAEAELKNIYGGYTDEEVGRLVKAADRIGEANIIVDDKPAMTVEHITNDEEGIYKDADLIIIDYLQLLSLWKSGESESEVSKAEECNAIGIKLKEFAQDNNAAVLILSQLTRGPEKRRDHRPLLDDLRDFNAVEECMDTVMFLYRDKYYDYRTKFQNRAEVIIARNCDGPIGTVELEWDADVGKFKNETR